MQNDIQINVFSVLAVFACTLLSLGLALYFALRRRVVLALSCVALFFVLFRPSMALSAELCQPHRYADGDTFAYTTQAGDERRVRVAGYDAPERAQPFSKAATQRLRELTQGGASCDCKKVDKYGRSVCTVRTSTGENVATAMLRAGFGCIDPRFEKEAAQQDRDDARAALAEAQAARRGMWAQPPVQCGFDYRKEKNK